MDPFGKWPVNIVCGILGGALGHLVARFICSTVEELLSFFTNRREQHQKPLSISAPYDFNHIASGADGLRKLASGELSHHVVNLSSRRGLESTVGHTPLIHLPALSAATNCTILAKVEYLNGAGNSPKDRVAQSIIDNAERHGFVRPNSGDVIYEGTVGSTGISLASLARARGYTAHIVMPDDQAYEKSDLLLKLGAKVERVTPAPITSPENYINLARRRAQEHTDDADRKGRGFFADQFENEANWRAHFDGTGPEIWTQTEGGKLDAFVAGAGTGGTISGVAMYLKDRMGLKRCRVVLADPQGSGLYNRVKYGVMFDGSEKEGTRRRQQVDSVVEGIGCNRVTANFEAGRVLIDDAVRVPDEQAVRVARYLAEKEGIFVGSSSAVNCKFFIPPDT